MSAAVNSAHRFPFLSRDTGLNGGLSFWLDLSHECDAQVAPLIRGAVGTKVTLGELSVVLLYSVRLPLLPACPPTCPPAFLPCRLPAKTPAI